MTACTAPPTPVRVLERAAALANELVDLAYESGDADISRVATDALILGDSLRQLCDWMAVAGGAEVDE